MICLKSSRNALCAVVITVFIIVGTSGFAIAFGDRCPCFNIKRIQGIYNSYEDCQYYGPNVSLIWLSGGNTGGAQFGAVDDTCSSMVSPPDPRVAASIPLRIFNLSEYSDAFEDCLDVLLEFKDTEDCSYSGELP